MQFLKAYALSFVVLEIVAVVFAIMSYKCGETTLPLHELILINQILPVFGALFSALAEMVGA